MNPDSPSTTAKLIAASTVLLHYSGDRDLVPEAAVELCERFLSQTFADRALAWSVRSPLTRWLWWAIEGIILHGIIRHYWYRKILIEKECRNFLRNGYKNVVILGAGFDTLALRLTGEFPDVKWFEYDHPTTQASKRRALKIEPSNIEYISLDFNTDLNQWPPLRTRSLIIGEGLFMYFEEKKIKEIFQWANRDGSLKNILIGTYMENVDSEPIGFRPRSKVIDWWLKNRKEQFLWHIEPKHLSSFAQSLSYELEKTICAKEMAQLIDENLLPSTLRGENMFVLSTNSPQYSGDNS